MKRYITNTFLLFFIKSCTRSNLLCLSPSSSFQLRMCMYASSAFEHYLLSVFLSADSAGFGPMKSLSTPFLVGETALSLPVIPRCLGVHKCFFVMCYQFIRFSRYSHVNLKQVMFLRTTFNAP